MTDFMQKIEKEIREIENEVLEGYISFSEAYDRLKSAIRKEAGKE